MSDSKITIADFDLWWKLPVGKRVQKIYQEYITALDALGLQEDFIRDPIKAAIHLGKKEQVTDFINMAFANLATTEELKEAEKVSLKTK